MVSKLTMPDSSEASRVTDRVDEILRISVPPCPSMVRPPAPSRNDEPMVTVSSPVLPVMASMPERVPREKSTAWAPLRMMVSVPEAPVSLMTSPEMNSPVLMS